MNPSNKSTENISKLVLTNMNRIFICRLCGEATDSYTCLFGEDGSKHTITKKIFSHLNLKITNEDLLPKVICFLCFHKLEEFHKFFLNSKNMQEILKNKINESLFSVKINIENLEKQNANKNKITLINENHTSVDMDSDTKKSRESTAPQKSNTKEMLTSCEVSSVNDSSLLDSQSDLMNLSVLLSCVLCSQKVASPKALIEHYDKYHCNATPTFKCNICHREYKILKDFNIHYKKHTGESKYICSICGKKCMQLSALKNHMAVHSDVKPFKCDKCEKSFKILISLKKHVISHLPDDQKPVYACTFCSKSFRSRFRLKSHTKIHIGEKNFVCDICGKSFVSKSTLNYHMTIHKYVQEIDDFALNKKLLECDYCGKKYHKITQLNEHRRLHTGELPYQCDFCPKRFRLNSTLIVHRRQHTGIKPYKCQDCNLAFTNWPNYNKHMTKKHYNTVIKETDELVVLKM